MDLMESSFTLFRRNLAELHESVESLSEAAMTSFSERTFPVCEETFSDSIPFVADDFTDFSLFMDVEILPAMNDFIDVDSESEIFTKAKDVEQMRTEEDDSANLPTKKRSKPSFDSKKKGGNNDSSPSRNKKRIRKVLFDSGSDMNVFQKSDVEPGVRINGRNTDAPIAVFCPGQSTDHWTSAVPWRKHASLPVHSRLSPVAPVFNKCHSEAQLTGSATNRLGCEDANLIGDLSRPFRLPLVCGKHPDLKAISHETMADVLHDRYPDVKENCIVVDCRYPYEFEAGHIVGARNIYSKDDIFKEFLLQSRSSTAPTKHQILIFHCEFSSERGPKLMRYLRNLDRDAHGENYPKLYYPEMYILEGGYKEFCEWHKDLCNPDDYKPMLHKDHAAELTFYRSQSKLYNNKYEDPIPRDHANDINYLLSLTIKRNTSL